MNSITIKQKPWSRMIALVDMNAFFTSIEQLDRPDWRHRPVCVTNGRTGTCIITASYEARAVGIKTGMRLREARTLAPDLTNLTKFSIHNLSLGAKRPLKVWMEMDSEACAEQAPVLLSRHCEALHNGFGG